MKCEICHVNDAEKSVMREVNGEVRELYVCESCARQVPHSGASSLTDVFFSLGLPGMHTIPEKIEDGVCPVCGLSREAFRAGRTVGCQKCYSTFAADIRSLVPTPFSEQPDSEQPDSDLNALQKKLKTAVDEERYEDAAALRDEIRNLSGGNHKKDRQ